MNTDSAAHRTGDVEDASAMRALSSPHVFLSAHRLIAVDGAHDQQRYANDGSDACQTESTSYQAAAPRRLRGRKSVARGSLDATFDAWRALRSRVLYATGRGGALGVSACGTQAAFEIAGAGLTPARTAIQRVDVSHGTNGTVYDGQRVLARVI